MAHMEPLLVCSSRIEPIKKAPHRRDPENASLTVKLMEGPSKRQSHQEIMYEE